MRFPCGFFAVIYSQVLVPTFLFVSFEQKTQRVGVVGFRARHSHMQRIAIILRFPRLHHGRPCAPPTKMSKQSGNASLFEAFTPKNLTWLTRSKIPHFQWEIDLHSGSMFKPAMLVFRGAGAYLLHSTPGIQKWNKNDSTWSDITSPRICSGSFQPRLPWVSKPFLLGGDKKNVRSVLKSRRFHNHHFRGWWGEEIFPPNSAFFWIHPSRWSDDGIYSCSYWQEIRKSQGPKIMCFFQQMKQGKQKMSRSCLCVNDLGDPLNIYNPLKLVPFVDLAWNKHVAFWRNRIRLTSLDSGLL